MDTVKIDLNMLESEKQDVIRIYKRQLDAFHHIKKELENVQWDDEHYDQLINSINIIGQALSSTLQSLTNGNNVYMISDLISVAEQYLDFAKKFPRLN